MHVKTSALQRVTDFIFNTEVGDIPETTLERAALQLLDTIGICAASTTMEAGIKGREIATRLFASADAETNAKMLFDGREVSLAGALYAAANQTDNLDGHDGYNPTKGHIGVVAVPALAILAQKNSEVSGREALTALTIAYEVSGRAAIALHKTTSDYHTSGAWNALAVVAMAARLRRHTAAQLRQGFGIAEYHGPRSQMMREIANPTMLHDGSSWGGLAGMSAVIAAELGFTGAPAVTIESAEAAPYWEDLGSFWQIDHQYVKPYPVCRWAHAAIDAAKTLCEKHRITSGDIAAIRINTFKNAAELYAGMPSTTSQAQYSLAFAVATVIRHGRIGLEHISNDGLRDVEVESLIQCIEPQVKDHHEQRYPEGRWADVEFTLHSGQVLSSGDIHASGGPEKPFGETDIIKKFNEFAVPALGDARADNLQRAILSLADAGTLFSTVSEHLYDPV